jgi:membrane fusion protein (multidrug efflux system)
MFARAIVKEGVNEQAILIPQQGVMRNPKGEPYALVVNGAGKVGMKMLTLEREIGNQWLVTAGLATGDQVIVEGLQVLQMLRPGTPVTVKAEPFKVGGTPPAGTQQPTAVAK